MSTTVADYVLHRLREWEVEQVFGYTGDGIDGLLAAWQKAGDSPRFVQAGHEEMAAYEACGYAKFSGRVGVCAATSGSGPVHLPNQMEKAESIFSSDANRLDVIKEGVKSKLQDFLPGSGHGKP